MPIHALSGIVTAIAATFAAALTIAYATLPRARASIRPAMLWTTAAAAGAAILAATLGSDLYAALGGRAVLKGTITARHASDGDALAVTAVVMFVLATLVARCSMRPGSGSGPRARIVQVVLVGGALTLLAVTAITVIAAMESVGSHHVP